MFSINTCSYKPVVSIFLIALLALAGCGGQDADSSFQKAQDFIESGKRAEAIIELKNALKADSQHLPSRRFLAELYYQAGDFQSAEKEAQRALAIEHNIDSEIVLDKSLLAMGRTEEVESRLEALEPIQVDSQPQLAVLKARMLLDKGNAEEAGSILKRIQSDSKSSSDIFVALARYYVLTNNIEGAKKVSLRAIEAYPDRRKPWLILGRIAMQENDYQKALEYFQKAESVPASGEDIPVLMVAIYGKSMALVRLGENDQAIAELDQYLMQLGPVPNLQYLKGLAQFQNRELKASKETLAGAVRNNPSFSPALLLLATVEYQLGSFEQARQHIRTYLAQQPEDPVGKRILGELELRLNSPEKAFEVLQPLSENASTTDSSVLALAGESALQSGSKELGVSYYKRAADLNPDDRDASTQYALALIRVGKLDQAISVLNDLEPSTAAPFTREALLVQAYARQNDAAAMNRLLDDMSARFGQNAAAQKFIGDVNLAQRNLVAAEEFYQHALAIDKKHASAIVGLAQIKVIQGEIEQAHDLSKQAYKMDPDNEQIAIYHARLTSQAKDYKPAVELLKSYILKHESATTSIGVLVQLALEHKDVKEISTLIDFLEREKIDNERMLNLAIRLALDIDNIERAEQLFAQLQTNYANEVTFLVTAGNLHIKAGRLELAREQIQRLLSLDPDHTDGLMLAASLEYAQGNFNTAHDYLQDVSVKDRNVMRYLLLSGQVAEALKNNSEAARDYLQGLKESGSLVFLANLYRVARSAKADGIEQEANEWVEKNASINDSEKIALIQAQHYTAKRDYAQAVAIYERMLDGNLSSANASTLNNYAWNLYYVGEYEKSLRIASNAYEASNQNPYIGDTLGWIMVNRGHQVEDGVALLRDSYRASNKHPDIGYHLAYGLVKKGETNEAREVLTAVIGQHSVFDSLDEAKTLLSKIENQ